MEPITLTYRYTADDARKGSEQIQKHLYKSQFLNNILAVLLYGCFASIFLWLVIGTLPPLAVAIVFGAVSSVFPISFLLVKLMNKSIVRRYFASLRDTEEIQWTTSESGIEVITTNSRWELKWPGIPCVVSTPEGFLYQTDSKNYYFVPTRAFSSPADIENLKTLVRQHATDFKELK